jgi:hypothetical protein
MVHANLIPASRMRARRTAGALRTWAAVNCAGALALAATWGVLAGTRDRGVETLRAQLGQAQASASDAQAALKRTSAELAGLTRQLGAAPDVRERPEWSVLLAALGRVRDEAVALTSFELAPAAPGRPGAKPGLPPRYQLHLSGLARDHRAATGFSVAVERTGLFSHVRLTDASAKSVAGGTVVSFSIDCVLDDTGGDGK